jgi:folate-binding protein YgfZ
VEAAASQQATKILIPSLLANNYTFDMNALALQELHHSLNATFTEVNGAEVVSHYGDALAEHTALCETVGLIDLSFRSRLCLTGADRVRFLHGQVTNDVKRLRVGDGCYAALVTAKGKMQSDLNIFCLQDELLLDFEPGLTSVATQRLEKYIVADEVQVVDVAPHYGLLGVQGPKAEAVLRSLGVFTDIPTASLNSSKVADATLGEIYLMNHPRVDRGQQGRAGSPLPAAELRDDGGAQGTTRPTRDFAGFDLFVPTNSLAAVADKLITAAKSIGGRACGWTAFETARIEAGIPRFGADMDETNIPLECGIEARAVSYNKGCYIGQEVLNRIHTIGHVNRELRGLLLADDLKTLPARGDKLFKDGKEVGYITSAIASPILKANIALGYARREVNAVGTGLKLLTGTSESVARIVEVPFAE